MSEKMVKAFLRSLNERKADDHIFLRPISEIVDLAKVWKRKPRITDTAPRGPYNFYFIKNNEGCYIGAVWDCVTDLFWFVHPDFRKQGHLTKALKTTIIPHLLQKQEKLCITIDVNSIGKKLAAASEKVAESIRFVKKSEERGLSTYSLSRDNYPASAEIAGTNTAIPESRINELVRQVNFYSRSIQLIQAEIEMKTGNFEYAVKLGNLAAEIERQGPKIGTIL